ncbi:dolichol phosphate-mannose biosynthesis regulatory [Amylostereum chailletii]|nr:dolichol phosphate-mannose biosynthesis regulatory [Amylostereum chailletii]
MAVSDKSLGGVMMIVAAAVFMYYTTWAVLLPFFNASSPLHAWFPSREWAIRLPAFILLLGASAIAAFVGNTIVNENRKKAQKAKMRSA